MRSGDYFPLRSNLLGDLGRSEPGHHASRAQAARESPLAAGNQETDDDGLPAKVCVLVPTRIAAADIAPLLRRLDPVLTGLGGEVLFVDDSDHTRAAVAAAARTAAAPVWLVHQTPDDRAGGLGGAVQAGLAAATARWTAIMDGDLRHPPGLLTSLIGAAGPGADVVVATRYPGKGGATGRPRFRGLMVWAANAMSRLLFPRALAAVRDPMSGFFAVRTAAVHHAKLRPHGPSVLLELLVRTPRLRVAEVPVTSPEHHHGRSGTSTWEAVRYLRQLVILRLEVPARAGRLLHFAVAGGSGILVNLLVLAVLLRSPVATTWAGGQIVDAVIAAQVAIGWNFMLTERWVFPHRSGHWVRRLFAFWAMSCGALLAQLPLAARLQPVVGGSYLVASAASLVILVFVRFAVCDRWLYRPAGRRRVTTRVLRFPRTGLQRVGVGQHRRHPLLSGAAAALAALALLVTIRAYPSAAARRTLPPPTLAQVDASIALAQGYLDGLFKPLPGSEAVQSEFYGLPLRAYFPGYRRWVLLGQGRAGDCLTGCDGPASLIAGPSGRSWEAEQVLFATPAVPGTFEARVTVDWAASPGHFAVTVSQVQLGDPATPAELWLDDIRLAAYVPGHPAAQVTRIFSDRDRSVLRSLRYTVRHATQEAYLYWRARANTAHAMPLAAFLRHNGFTPGVDLRAAIFGQAASLPAAMPFTVTGPDNAYPDCSHLPPPTLAAYPYTSKVCLVGVNTFLLTARGDPFLQAFQALQTLNSYADPTRHYPLLVTPGLDGTTPDQTADHLEQLWGQLEYGIPACTPVGCDTTQVSGLRTFAFGALETLLGYRFGQTARRHYADAAAAEAIMSQIGADGIVRAPGRTFLRPAQAGAYPIYWNADHQFVPVSGASKSISDLLSMPPEYAGLIVSDSETTFDGWAFLVTYRCARFGVGCTEIPDAVPAAAP